jgi:hypothetical protein
MTSNRRPAFRFVTIVEPGRKQRFDNLASNSAAATLNLLAFGRVLHVHLTLAAPNRGCVRYKRRVSDHLPLVAQFRIAGPDDD